MSPRRDPHVADRLAALDRQRRVEAALFPAVLRAVSIWLDTVRALVLDQPLPAAAVDLITPPIRASATPDFEDISAATQVWARAVAEHIDPVLQQAFGDAFQDAARRADISPLPFQLEYLETVHDRLRIWPEGAWEELRPELLEMLSEGMDYEQMTERIGRILDIDAPTRRIRAEISALDRIIDDPATTGVERKAARAQRRALWEQHDESLKEWQWKARRIARTEMHGAIEGGAFAAACAVEAAGGTAMYKAWLSTTDERVRGTHVVADGQIVRLRERFTVGIAELLHPGEAGGPAHEVIQCRCSTRYLRADEVQAELQGPFGGRGVAPRGARMGPDDVDDAAAAAERWRREQRGEPVEDLGDQREPDPEPPTPEPESTPDAPPDADPIPDTSPETPSDDDELDDLEDVHVDADEDSEDDGGAVVSDDTRARIEQARADIPVNTLDDASDEEIAAHVETARAVGEAFWADITTAMDADTTVRAARTRRRESDTTGARRAVAQAETAVIRRALGEVRTLGGREQAVTTRVPTTVRRLPGGARNGDEQTVRDLRAAEEWFPAEWLELADDRGELLLARGDRAAFVPDVDGRDLIVGIGEGRSYSGGLGSAAVAGMVSALAARMLVAVPGLARMFAEVAGTATFGAVLADILGRGARWVALAALVLALILLL